MVRVKLIQISSWKRWTVIDESRIILIKSNCESIRLILAKGTFLSYHRKDYHRLMQFYHYYLDVSR